MLLTNDGHQLQCSQLSFLEDGPCLFYSVFAITNAIEVKKVLSQNCVLGAIYALLRLEWSDHCHQQSVYQYSNPLDLAS